MADPFLLFEIPLYRLGESNNWASVPVMGYDHETITIASSRARISVKDEDLTLNEDGTATIDLEPLDLKSFFPKIDLPKTVDIPAEILEARKEKRRLEALAKNAISIIPYQCESMYFYIDGGKLRILHRGKEAIAEKIELIHNRKAVNVEALELTHPYLELPLNVVTIFEKVLREKELRDLALIPAGKSLLNGLDYFKLNNLKVSSNLWDKTKTYFEDWGEKDGWVTCHPAKVAEILKIPIKDGI